MADRSGLLWVAVLLSSLLFLAGCGSSSTPGAPSLSPSFTTATSSDGDATAILPSSGPLAPGSASVAPATLSFFNPNAILGTYYLFTVGGVSGAKMQFTVSIKYRPASLPIGVPTSQLAIARFDPNAAVPLSSYTLEGGAYSGPAEAVSTQVDETGVYGILIEVPFAGNVAGRYTGSFSGAIALTISSAGVVEATVTPANGPAVETTGTASYTGQVRFSIPTAPGITMGFTGLLRRSDGVVSAAGAWTDNVGHSGTWSVS